MDKSTLYIRNLPNTYPITISGSGCKTENPNIITSLIDSIDDKGNKLIFRYVGNDILIREYNCGLDNISLLSQYIFLYGDKSKLFYEDLNQKSYNLFIDEIDKRNFEFIYDKLVKIFVHTDKLSSTNTKNALYNSEDYLNAHQYFLNVSKEYWINKILKINETERQLIKDYYVSYLHTIGLPAFGRNTYFLSTSTDYHFCRQWQIQNNRNNKDGIILVGWTKKCDIKKPAGKRINNLLKKYNLLTFNSTIFNKQKEVTIKCGLLPHFIIGYFYKDCFEINPNILTTKEADIPNIVVNGLNIDQQKFLHIFSKTNFRSFYIQADDQYFQF